MNVWGEGAKGLGTGRGSRMVGGAGEVWAELEEASPQVALQCLSHGVP